MGGEKDEAPGCNPKPQSRHLRQQHAEQPGHHCLRPDEGPARRFLQRRCRRCSALFFVCAGCDRGHAYCADACRLAARQRQLSAAAKRHRRSPEGAADHRDAERSRRARRRLKLAAVAYQTSAKDQADVLMPSQAEAPVAVAVGVVVCAVCGASRAFADVRVQVRQRRGVHGRFRRARGRDPPTPQR